MLSLLQMQHLSRRANFPGAGVAVASPWRIDPLRIAPERYVVMAERRPIHRRVGDDFPNPESVATVGRHMARQSGPRVDTTGQTPKGQSFAHLSNDKRSPLAKPEQFSHAPTEKLTTDATGRGLDRSDREEFDRNAPHVTAQYHGIRDHVREVVHSEWFRNK